MNKRIVEGKCLFYIRASRRFVDKQEIDLRQSGREDFQVFLIIAFHEMQAAQRLDFRKGFYPLQKAGTSFQYITPAIPGQCHC